MAEELVTGPEGLIVFQGAESLQVRAALRAAKRPIKNRYPYTQALTRAKDTEKTWMEGQGRDHSGAVTHMHANATEFQSICGYLLWENEGWPEPGSRSWSSPASPLCP